MPPGEAKRMGAPAPPLAEPQPEFPAAGSPSRTVQMPDPAVPREAPPVVPTGLEPVVPGGMQGAAPAGRTTAGEQAGEDAAQEAAVAGPRDISELLAQALEEYRRTALRSGGAAPEGADAGELIAQALAAVAPRTEGAKEASTEAVSSGGQDAGRGVPKAQTPAGGGGVVEPSGGRTKGEGVEEWMWEWREWRQVAPGEPCPAGLAYRMDLHGGTSWARLPANLRARLDAAEAARGGGADERPLAPFPPRPDTPPEVVAAGDGAEGGQEAEEVEDEEAYGPGESALALMFEDDAGPDVYAGMAEAPANDPLRPMPTAVPPPPLGSCERRHCRYHAAEGAHRHRLTGTGQREAGMLASALERYELQRPGQVAREMALAAASPGNGQVRCVQLGDAAVLGHRPGDVRAAEPQESLPLSVRLSVVRLLGEAGLEDVRRDEGLYVALWRGGADAWRREQAGRPLTPQALGSHALLVALHPEGAEVVFGADRLLLTGDGAVLVPTSSSYRLESRGGDLKLLVVVGTRLDGSAAPQGSERAIPVGGNGEAGRGGDGVGQEQPTGEEQQQDQPEVAGEEVDVQAIVAAALARISDAAGPPPTTEELEEEDQRRGSEDAQVAMEQDEEPEFKGEEAQGAGEQDEELVIVGAKEAREVSPREPGVADKAGPKTGEEETCRHWAKGWCMRADACRYAHPQPPVPRGVPQELLLILQAMARVGALSLDRSRDHGRGHGTLLQHALVKAQGGGLPAVVYAVESGGLTEWAVALPCGMAGLLTPFPVVPWRDMVTVQEANLGWVCTWHTHPAGMDPREWQAKAVVTYLSWSLPAAPGAWAQWWDRALSWARDGSAVAACPDLPREPASVQPWTVSLHLPTVAARLATTDPEVSLLGDREGPGLRLSQGLEVRTARLPSPVDGDILGGLQFTRASGADVWTAVHRQLPDARPQVYRPPGHERLVGVEWRVWAANGPCPPVVVLPRRTNHPSWETVAVLWGWVAVRGADGHVFTAPRGTVIETDGGTALQLTAEPLTTHAVVAVLQWGANKPQPWRDQVAVAVWRDLPVLRAAVWSGGAGRHLPGALPWLRGCGDASPPPAELRGALERVYSKPRHQFLVAADHGVELSDDVVALAADVVQCLAPHAMMLPREGWEGQRHDQTPAALLIARYVELGGSEAVYLDRLETPDMRHWTAHHLVAPDTRLAVDPLGQPVVSGAPPQWPHTWDMAVRTMRMSPRGQRAGWPGAERLLAEARAAQVQQPAGNTKDCGVCALMSAVGTLLRVPRPGNLLSALDRRWVAAVVLNRDMGPIARLPSLGELPAAVLEALPAPRTPLDLANVPHNVGLPGARMQHALLCMAAASDGGMSMLATVSLQHVQDAMQQQRMHAPQPWEESAKRWLRVESVSSTHTVGMADMGQLVVLEGAEYWACVRVETGGLEWVVVVACRLRRQQSRGPACFRVFQECLSGLGPVRRAHRCKAEDIPPAPAVFVEVTRPPVVQGQDVWPVAPSNMWQAEHAAGICRALQGHAAALPRAPAAQSSSNRPAASLALLHSASRAWYWVVAALEPHSSALRLYDRGQGTVLTVRPADLEALHLSALSGDGGDALYLQGTVAGAAATRFRRQSGGDALRLVMAENMGPWLRAFSTSRWRVEGDREKFADAWRRWVDEQFPVGGMLHLPQPPGVPPVRPAAPPAAAAKQAPKAAPKPPPKRSPPPQYGAYVNIRYVLRHFGGDLATDQRATKTINVCPWSRLDGAGHCTWKAGTHCRPTHLHPKDLLDHIQRDHVTDPAQRDQALAMLAGVMPGAKRGLSRRPRRGPERSRCTRVPALRRGAGRRRRQHGLERLGLQRGVGQ